MLMDLIWYISIAAFVSYGGYRLARSSSEFKTTLKKIREFARASAAGRMVIIGACALGAWLVLEAVILGGPRIYDGPLIYGKSFPFEVETPNERYVFTVGRSSGRRKGRPGGSSRTRLRYEITAPNGVIVFNGEDGIGKRIRRFSYTPSAPGTYMLKVDRATPSTGRGLISFQLNRNDDSVILSRISHLWPIELGVWSPFYPRQQIPGHTVNWAEWAATR
jgi:hypothetical protein